MSSSRIDKTCRWLVCLACAIPAMAASPLPLRVAITDSMSYPFLVLDANGRVGGGLLKELGDEIAAELSSPVTYELLSRRRIEPAIIKGEVDINCYGSPKWSDHAKEVQWTIATLPQIERVVVRQGQAIPERIPDDFAGKRVGVILGYHYASIQPLFDSGRAKRLDQTRVPQLFRLVADELADLLISSEAEIQGYYQANPSARSQFAVGGGVFSIVETQCLVSPKSNWPLEQINKALAALMARGEIEKLAKRYGMSMH